MVNQGDLPESERIYYLPADSITVTVTLTYDAGTIRIESDRDSDPPLSGLPSAEIDPRSKTARAPAYQYAAIRDVLRHVDADVDDRVLDTEPVSLSTSYELRGYQQDALDAWIDVGRRGILELPTGAGKTVIALAAMAVVSTPTLIVVPTIDLLEQWQTELETEFDVPIGQLGGGEQQVESVTVSTYDSAYLRADELGGRFGLVVFDEVHHLGAEGYQDIARLMAAPDRLGLTATFERPDGAHEAILDLVGPKVYDIAVDELAGDHLAPYEIRRIEVELTPGERAEYDDSQGTFIEYIQQSNITFTSGSDYLQLVKRSGTDPKAREALLAKQRARELMMNAENKRHQLARILDRHRGDRIIVFTAHTELVYRLSEQFLLPAITNETGTVERRDILERFREGTYSRVVAANVLDEGVDVPDANVAVVISGSGSEREFTQRLGRILRPKADGGRAVLYELVSAETAEERVSQRRR